MTWSGPVRGGGNSSVLDNALPWVLVLILSLALLLQSLPRPAAELPPPPPPPLPPQLRAADSVAVATTVAAVRGATNDAPVREVVSSRCKSPLFWGKGGGGAGWWVCGDALVEPCGVVYSYGLGADWSFDVVASSPPHSCEVHGFDPSDQNWRDGMHGADYSRINYAKQYPSPPTRSFHNWGLGSASHAVYPKHAVPCEWPGLGDPALSKTNSEAWEMRSIAATMELLKHQSLSILKVDVEGGEWIALSSLLSTMADKLAKGAVTQLLVEWHWDPHSTLRNARNQDILRKIRRLGFVPWKVNRHVGSDCCLDVSYVWEKPSLRPQKD